MRNTGEGKFKEESSKSKWRDFKFGEEISTTKAWKEYDNKK